MLCLSIYCVAQDKTRDQALELMAQDTCECIKNDPESFAEEVSMKKKELSLGLCLLKSFNARKNESSEFANTGMDNFEALGEEVGMKLVANCTEDFMSIFSDDQWGEIIEDKTFEYDDVPLPPAAKNENDLQLEADLVSLNNDAVSYIKVKDMYDKTHFLIISEQFQGFELLKKSNYNKSFRIYYREQNYYDLSERKYVKKKIIKYLEYL